jgi:DNA-binding CsgD family transcriptional regulator
MRPLSSTVIDDPPGTALGMELTGKVVLTRVTGLPYLWDVLERSPHILIVREDFGDARTLLEHLAPQDDEFLYLGPRLEYLPLTSCERRALQMIAFGLSNAEIARRIDRKVSTVNTQAAAILAKLGVSSRHAARNLYWGHDSATYLDN